VKESFRQLAGAIYGISMGAFGGGLGAATFGSMMSQAEPIGVALGSWLFIMAVGFLGGAIGVQALRERRQKALEKLIEDLAAQIRTSIDETK